MTYKIRYYDEMESRCGAAIVRTDMPRKALVKCVSNGMNAVNQKLVSVRKIVPRNIT